ncbi:MAG: histidine phosphatase family protein [Opitutaceae bacterium]|nr:histidine phosphatase family protein [Verrucomicrobiales bacterium]
MNSTTRLLLVRHGEVENRYHRVFGGSQIDMSLSERGHEQARHLAEFLDRESLDAIYASPMKRALQTLAPMNTKRGHIPEIVHHLQEVNFGDWTGLSWDEVRSRFDVSAYHWLDLLDQAAIPNAESGKQFRARIEPAMKDILAAQKGKTVAIICHGGVIRMILSILLDLPLPKTSSFEIDYASVTTLSVASNKTEVKLLNFAPWQHLA